MRTAPALLLAGCLALPAMADVYKCRLPGGQTEISNRPCASDSGTIAVRPEEKVSEAARRDAEREVERMRSYVEQREAAQRAEAAAEREQQARRRSSPALPRNYGSLEECREEIGRQALEASVRQQLEAECPNYLTAAPPPVYVPVPVGIGAGAGSGLSLCIQQVQGMTISAAEKSRRLRDCEAGQAIAPARPRPLPPPAPPAETRPATPAAGSRAICPPADKHCRR